MAFEITNECGMDIRKTLLGTVRILNGPNTNVINGIANRTHFLQIGVLSQFQIVCPMVKLLVEKYVCYGHRTRWKGWNVLRSRKRIEMK
jgi:hypothetical protein